MNKEELLEYARKHYPIGTHYKPAHVNIGVNEVTDTQYRYSKDKDEYIHVGGKYIENDYNYCIYANGKWATIVEPNYKELQNKAWEIFKDVKEGDKYISTRGNEIVATKDAFRSSGSAESNCYIECGPGFLWEIRNGKELYGTLLSNQKMKYELGKIKFKNKKPEDRIPKFYIDEDGIPKDKIIHGSTILNENYEYAEIVDFYNEYYLVKYLSRDSKYVTLGFKEDVLEPYIEQPKEKWIPKVGDWVVSLVDREGYRKKGDVFQVLEVSGDCIYYAQNTNGYINTFRPAEPHEIPKENLKSSVLIPAYMVDGVCTISPPETKPEIDSWCIKLTEENRGLLFQNKHVFKASWNFDDIRSYYGFNKSNNSWCSGDKDSFDKVLTTEEFCKKFNITESYKWVELNFNKLVNTGAIQYKEEEIKIQVKKSKTIKI